MTLASAMAFLGPAASAKRNRRRHARVRVTLLGRYMLADRTEFPCQTIDMSPGGAALFAPIKGEIGERVVVYLDDLGRLEGVVVRQLESGFAVKFNVPAVKRDKLADQLTWLANRRELGLPEDRRHDRVTPIEQRYSMCLPDGMRLAVVVLDVSVSGAMIQSEIIPEAGAIVTIGTTKGRVVRRDENQFGIEFLRLLPSETFDENVKL